MTLPELRKLAYRNDSFIRFYINYFDKAQDVAKSSIPEDKRRELIEVQEQELKKLLRIVADAKSPENDLNILNEDREESDKNDNEESDEEETSEDNYQLNQNSLFQNKDRSSPKPSAPNLMTNSILKIPILSQFMNNNYENKQSTIKINGANDKNKGKLNTNPPQLSESLQSNSETLDLIKYVAVLAGYNKSKRLDSNTKKFIGSPSEDVDDWLLDIEQGFISSKMKEEDRLNAGENFVEKVPAQILKKHITNLSTLKLFEKELRNTYTNKNKEYWKKGHYANKCYANLNKINSLKISKNEEEEKVYVALLEERGPKNICSVKILKDKKPLKIGLDCGATNSVMNHMTAIKNDIEILRSDFDHDDQDVLLELDWFNKTECGIYPSQ
ncbi:unnamed protein product [Brachionus calyciflorus]|uniref:Uncharacterized protein n=1 Tax=Brachionus calyciflorus TaxID=104777 RepID=A0A813S3R5_9BILA|nr:unnamed protein product [Brachionus calyciflorus]